MDDDLLPSAEALGDLTDTELRALVAGAEAAPQIAPGLLAWLAAAFDWELNRRAGVDFELLPPEAAIPPEEDAVSIEAAMVLRSTFEGDDRGYNRSALPEPRRVEMQKRE